LPIANRAIHRAIAHWRIGSFGMKRFGNAALPQSNAQFLNAQSLNECPDWQSAIINGYRP
jgi:hypothetical protein